MHEMDAFLRYDPETTYARYDHVTYAEFASRNALPPSLRLVFNTFSRAFFADPERMSMAELIKSFHFYYLSHDGGLLYDYPTDDFEPALLAPLRAVLAEQGVDLRLGVDARSLGGDADTLVVDGERFDDVVIATHVVAARDLLTDSPLFVEHPEWSARVSQLRAGQRYAVLRVWFDRDVRTDVAEFVITERVRVLDAVCLVHRTEATSAAWARPRGASVIELHCYAVPDALADDAAIREALLDDLPAFFPELDGAARLGEHLRVARDFAAFHVGQHAIRPEVATPDPRVSLAGDWVRLPFPAMLMEGAVASGRLAANRVLDRHGLQGAPVWSVPARGMLAGVPEPPKPPHIRARLSVPPA
jgi:isorenieratene synthase